VCENAEEASSCCSRIKVGYFRKSNYDQLRKVVTEDYKYVEGIKREDL